MVSQNAVIAALSSTALISLAPNVLLFLFPHFASGEGQNSKILSLGQALAAGGLLGDVFLHVVPHSGGSPDVGLWILLGFSIFLLTDMVMRSLGHDHQHDHQHKESDKKTKDSSSGENWTSTVLLNLTADAMHNVSKRKRRILYVLSTLDLRNITNRKKNDSIVYVCQSNNYLRKNHQ